MLIGEILLEFLRILRLIRGVFYLELMGMKE